MEKLEAIYARVCGLDVHKKSVVACRRRFTSRGRVEKEVATRHKGGYLSAQYYRLASRRGKNRAIVAVGHTILVAAYYILKDEVEDHDLGSDHFDRLRRKRTVSHLVSRLQRLGYNVSLEAIEPQAA